MLLVLGAAPAWHRSPAAAVEVRVSAVNYGRPLFAAAPPAWTRPFEGFQRWMRTAEGRQAVAGLAPTLAYLRTIDLSKPAGAIAIAPLAR